MEKPKALKKRPKQKRSQEVVEAILGGATRILSKVPFGLATTDKIAESAGVGVGSLYDYFPNKKSIVMALMDNRAEKLAQDYEKFLQETASDPIPEVVEKTLKFISSHYVDQKFFLREIFALAPESGRMELLFETRIRVAHSLAEHLHRHRGYDLQWSRNKAFILMHAVVGILEGFVMMPEAPISKEHLERELRILMLAAFEHPLAEEKQKGST